MSNETGDFQKRLERLEGEADQLRRLLYRYGPDSAGHRRLHGIDSHIPRNNWSASVAPTATDDTSKGYGIGSTWKDTTHNNSYQCLSAAVGAAVWHGADVISETGGPTNLTLGAITDGQILKRSGTTVIGAAAGGGGMKTAGVGYFLAPAGPGSGTTVTSGAADAYGTYTALITSTAAAIYIVGISCKTVATLATYGQFMIGTGGAGAETGVSEFKLGLPSSNTAAFSEEAPTYFPIWIPVATSTRVAVKSADSVGSVSWIVTLICINQSNVVAI